MFGGSRLGASPTFLLKLLPETGVVGSFDKEKTYQN